MKSIKFLKLLVIAFFCLIVVACESNRSSTENQNKEIEYIEARGVLIPQESELEPQGDELLIYLSQPTKIQGYLVRKSKHTNDHCTLDENGNLIFFVQKNDLIIDSIPCKRQKEVLLYPSGKLFRCHLASRIEHSNEKFRKGAHVIIDEEGVMKKFSLNEFWRIRNKGLYPQHH